MIRLRELDWGDLDAVHGLISRMDVVRYMLLPLCTRAESEQFLRDSIVEPPLQPWKSIVRAIVDCPSGSVVGLCGVVVLRGTEEGEIWYLIHPDHQGQGVATEAARQLLTFGFGDLGLHRMWATCVPENPASARVLEKAGMRQEGFHVEKLKIHGAWKSCYLYAILAREWRERN